MQKLLSRYVETYLASDVIPLPCPSHQREIPLPDPAVSLGVRLRQNQSRERNLLSKMSYLTPGQ